MNTQVAADHSNKKDTTIIDLTDESHEYAESLDESQNSTKEQKQGETVIVIDSHNSQIPYQRSQRCPWCTSIMLCSEEISTYKGKNKLYAGWLCHAKCNPQTT